MGEQSPPTSQAIISLGKNTCAAPAQLLGPDLFPSLWSACLSGLTSSWILFYLLLFLSCFHFRSLLLILESEVSQFFPSSAQVKAK